MNYSIKMKMKTILISAAFVISFTIAGMPQTASNSITMHEYRIDSTAIWSPGMSIMQNIRNVCSEDKYPDFGKCFVEQMKQSGASPQAVEFAKLTDNQGYLRDFRKFGNVDVAYSNFPFRANENQVCFLVNGSPNMIDVDGYNFMPFGELKKNGQYKLIQKKYHDVSIWPGDRYGTNYPDYKILSGGGQRFIFNYQLHNGCHACEIIGYAKLAFDFNKRGKFLGVKVLDVKTASVSN